MLAATCASEKAKQNKKALKDVEVAIANRLEHNSSGMFLDKEFMALKSPEGEWKEPLEMEA